MSALVTVQTQFTDRDAIVAALQGLGFTKEDIEVHETPVALYGENQQKAEIIVRRHRFNGYSDIGFAKQTDGTYSFIVSDTDQAYGFTRKMGCKSYREAENKLKQAYAEKRVTLQATKGGWATQRTQQGGKVVLKLSRYV